MTKAKSVIDTMNDIKKQDEQVGKNVPKGSPINFDDLKIGDQVQFKKGHEYEGEVAKVMDWDAEKKTLHVERGHLTLPEVPASDLLKSQQTHMGQQ